MGPVGGVWKITVSRKVDKSEYAIEGESQYEELLVVSLAQEISDSS